MEEIKIAIALIKEIGPKAAILILIGWVARKEISIINKKKSGEYVSFSTIRDVSEKVDNFIPKTEARLASLEKDQQGQIIMIEKRQSEIDTLRIVSDKMFSNFADIVKEMQADSRETRDDIREIKKILMQER